MSGHSKWATTKRQKASVDAKRGAIFTKIANLLTVAAREKGGDPDTNFMLRMAIDKAKAANMPKDNIDRAIKRGTGEGGGATIEELIYEGIGPANSQFVVKVLTDNKNRAAANVRHLFGEHGGALGTVMWNFEKKGVIRIEKSEVRTNKLENEDIQLELIEKGAQEIENEEEGMTIYTKMEDLQPCKRFLDEKSIPTESAEIEYVAKDTVEFSGEDREKIENFIEALEESEDVADYFTNADI